MNTARKIWSTIMNTSADALACDGMSNCVEWGITDQDIVGLNANHNRIKKNHEKHDRFENTRLSKPTSDIFIDMLRALKVIKWNDNDKQLSP